MRAAASRARAMVVATASVLATGCSPAASGYESPRALAEAYARLHDARDLDGMMKMVVGSDTSMHREAFANDLDYRLVAVTTRPLAPSDLDPWRRRGMRPSLPPVAWLEVRLETPGAGASSEPGITTSRYLIGRRDGRCFVASTER